MKNRIAKGDPNSSELYLEYFESLTQFSAAIQERPLHPECNEDYLYMKNDKEWNGSNNFDEANELMTSQKLWTDVYERIKISNMDIEVDGTTNRIGFKNSIYGTAGINVGRMLAGAPDCGRQMTITESQKRGKIVDIYFNPTVSGGMNARVLQEYGIAVFNTVKSVEAKGYRVNLYLVISVSMYETRSKLAVTVKVKDSTQPIEMNSMLFAVAHPSMFRRFGIGYLNRYERWQSGSGKPISADEFKRNEIMWHYDENPNNSFYLRDIQNMPSGVNRTEQSFREYLINEIAQQMKDNDEGKRDAINGKVQFNFN